MMCKFGCGFRKQEESDQLKMQKIIISSQSEAFLLKGGRISNLRPRREWSFICIQCTQSRLVLRLLILLWSRFKASVFGLVTMCPRLVFAVSAALQKCIGGNYDQVVLCHTVLYCTVRRGDTGWWMTQNRFQRPKWKSLFYVIAQK